MKARTGEISHLTPDIRLTLARFAAIGALAIGAVVATAWIVRIPALIPLDASFPGMPLEVALCLVLCGLSLLLSLARSRGFHLAGGLLVVPVALAALLQAAEYAVGAEAGAIFVAWFPSSAPLERLAGGMSPNSTTGLLAFSVTQIYVACVGGKPNALFVTIGGLVASGVSLAALAGYATGTQAAYDWRGFLGMAPHSGLGVWLLGCAHLLIARHPLLRQSGRWPFLVAVLATAFGLFFDLSTPAYLGANFIYIPVVLSSVWFYESRTAFALALVCSIFAMLGYFSKLQYLDPELQRFIGRSIGVATLFIVATLIFFIKRAGVRNERARLRFEALMDNSPDAVVTIDRHGIVRQFNLAAEQLFRYAAADVVGKNVKILMPEPYHSAHDGYLRHHDETGQRRIIGTIREVSGRRSDGVHFPLDLSIAELPSEGEKEFVGVLRDLTPRRRQEESLRQTLTKLSAYAADLERSNKELDDFAYIASHDMKEPLRGIHNHSRFLLEDYAEQLDEDAHRRLGRLVHLSQRMEKLVNDLLFFARIGRQELAVRPTDLGLVINDVLSTLEQFQEEKHARVVVIGDLPEITCDTVRVTEVFRNLIVNAVKYNDKAEKLVEIGCLDSHVDAAGQARHQVFFVRDNGKGIAPEFHEDIFRMFKRLERPDDDDGTGSGLTFVRKIVQRHGGQIWLESTLEQGTTFFFTLASE
jgi:PAS domain S-box-containing protein